MVRTCPFGPAGPIGLPFSEIVIPPAFPRRSVTSFTPSTVRVVCASMLAENAYLPSLRASTHAASSAVISTCTVASGLGGVTRATAGAGLGSAGRCSTTCAGVAAGSRGGGGGAFALVEGEGCAATGADGGAVRAALWAPLCMGELACAATGDFGPSSQAQPSEIAGGRADQF